MHIQKIKYSIHNSEETNQKFVLQSLNDILEKVNEVDYYIISSIKTIEEFTQNSINYRMTERCFGVISEATNRINKVNTQIEIINNKALITLINKPYYEIKPEMVWEIVQRDLLNLKIEIKAIISSLKHS